MKGDRVSQEDRDRALAVAFKLMGQGMKADAVQAELRSRGLFAFAVNSLNVYYNRWKKGSAFTDIVVDQGNGVIHRPTALDTDDGAEPPPSDDKHRITPLDSVNGNAGDDQCYTPSDSDILDDLDNPCDTPLDAVIRLDDDNQCYTPSDTAGQVDDNGQRYTPSNGDQPQGRDNSVVHRLTLLRVRKMIDSLEIADRAGQTAKGRQATTKTVLVGARLPDELVETLRSLPGPLSRHIEKAILVYVQAMNEPIE